MNDRFSFEFKIMALMLLMLVLVGITGTFTYKRFSSIIRNFSEEARPDLRLLTLKSLVNDINVAENSVKSFSLTKDTVYLNQFYNAASSADQKMEELLSLDVTAKETPLPIDTLDSLISGKLSVLRNLLLMQDEFRVQEALDKVVHQIRKAAELEEEEIQEIAESKIEEINEPVQTAENEQEETVKKRRGFLSRLFGKNEEETADEIPVEPKDLKEAPKTKSPLPVKPRKTQRPGRVSLTEINREVQDVKKEEKNIEQAIRAQELAYILADREISEKIRMLLKRFEEAETEYLAEQGVAAEKAVKRTNQQIGVFCVVTALLLIFMAYVIVNYMQNDRKYRKVLKQARKDAEELALAKERFMANISHEIRTPMNAIAGFTEQLSGSELNESQRDQLQMVQRSVDHLNYLINDVLDFTKLQSGKLKLEVIGFRPAEILNDVAALMRNLAADKPVQIQTEMGKDVPAVLIGDPFRLKQILLNLVGNAVKFTEQGKVFIGFKAVLKKPDSIRLRLEIRDTGIGMSEEQLQKVFREFEQAELSTARVYGGTGLGLSITKMLVELHEGNIDIKSQRLHGTSIIIEIPYKTGRENDLRQEDHPSEEHFEAIAGLHVLVADDEPYNRKLLETILNKHRIVSTEVTTGTEAINELQKNHYDLILMDVRMPDMNGIEATYAIRKMHDQEKKNIPIVALTAAAGDEDRKRYQHAGMNYFLSKPFTERQLLTILKGCVENKTGAPKMTDNQVVENERESLDFQDLRELSGSDDQFYTDMLDMFRTSTTTGLHELREAFGKSDWPSMAEIAHRLASPAKHLSALRLYETLKVIEENSRNGEELLQMEQELGKAEDAAHHAFRQVEKELETFRASKEK